MKNKFMIFLMGVFLLLGVTGSASAFGLNNWYFDYDGAGGNDKVLVNELFDIISPNLVDTTFTSPTEFDFTNYGIVYSATYDSTKLHQRQVTAIYTFTGDATLNGAINFTGGTFDLYVEDGTGASWGTTGDPSIYGANDGQMVASFDLSFGTGLVDTEGLPNGQFSITYKANSIEAGYFFLPDGVTDMSGIDPITLTMGFTTTNASHVEVPDPDVVGELKEYAGIIDDPVNDPPHDFWLSANGQFRIDVVPEPTTIFLFGAGLLGLAGISRKRLMS